MEIYHVSAECFPAAKVGGLADVVGALPKYINRLRHSAKVVIPGYDTKFSREQQFEDVFSGEVKLGVFHLHYTVVKEKTDLLGFELYQIKIPQLFDRPEIYGFEDDTERFTAFQIAFLDWITETGQRPDIVHCHDHHTGLIPFMMQHCFKYGQLNRIPTVLTIHNAQYQGWFSFDKMHYLPEFAPVNAGYLEWNGAINPLACAIKCVWKLTTVSPTYLEEMMHHANGLENLLRYERIKSVGILNGIDTEVWNSKTDAMLVANYDVKTMKSGKSKNKKVLCEQFALDEDLPIFAFIGRLVYEKGAELLPEIARRILTEYKGRANVLILGSGDPSVEDHLRAISHFHREHYNCYIGYNEQLAHLVYGGSDFLLMPSRVEPCGLNQMYSLRYGTVPIVRRTGGLRDTVIDMGDGGFGICHDQTSADDVLWSVGRALELFADQKKFDAIRKTGMQIDHSWDSVAQHYIEQYLNLKR
ncbi:glycogen synthase [Flavobacterium sp. MAH-1]|uniref:Glycogen synthase n=1 Tax=Flavobacterium agri TaxID=2743471 RepID=A0A7Y8Y4N9_9FLAO|nr:glycogen synthase [Flavobacterium agri]NUY82372.1 glycogen synthase [Flavobacterium agri]NYA72396.1 glycogen synthase [Flavobacterium agri]